jgi:hypothetical protein
MAETAQVRKANSVTMKRRTKTDPKRHCCLCGKVARDTVNSRPMCAECIKNGALVEEWGGPAFDDMPPIFGRRGGKRIA